MAIQLSYVEKDIEDLLEKEMEHFFGLKFVARQFKTPVGIIDIIARNPSSPRQYYVIEIKREVLDVSAYAQVQRYTKWLNSERAKDGKRLFVPLLVGPNLHNDIVTLCERFREPHNWYDTLGRVFYSLVNFDVRKGVTFHWISPAQEKHSDNLEYCFNHAEFLWSAVDRLEADKYHLEKQLQSKSARKVSAKLEIVKGSTGQA